MRGLLLVLALVFFTQPAQQDCRVVVHVSHQLADHHTWQIYTPKNGEYTRTAIIEDKGGGLFYFSVIAANGERIATIISNHDYSTDVRIYNLTGENPYLEKVIPNTQIALRHRGWSHQGDQLLLRSFFEAGNDDELLGLDVEQGSTIIKFPSQQVRNPKWSPDDRFIAYMDWAPDYVEDSGYFRLTISDTHGQIYREFNLEGFGQFEDMSWWDHERVAIGECKEDCKIHLYSIHTGEEQIIDIGHHRFFYHLPQYNAVLLSGIGQYRSDILSLYLLDLDTGTATRIRPVKWLYSLPMISASGRYAAYMGDQDQQYTLFVTDLTTRTTFEQRLPRPLPEIWAHNMLSSGGVDDLFILTYWHPSEDRLLFIDGQTIYVYDAETQTIDALFSVNDYPFEAAWNCFG